MDTRNTLIEIRNDTVECLRRYNPPLVAELEAVLRAIDAIDQPQVKPGEYANLTIIDAVNVQLRRTMKPQSPENLKRALIAGGTGKETPAGRESAHRIAQSISYHVHRGKLVLIEGCVGLPEWVAVPNGDVSASEMQGV